MEYNCIWQSTGMEVPVIFWGMYPHQEHEVEHLWEELLEIVSENDFLLVAFQVEDWNRDFSPWKHQQHLEQKDLPDKAGIL